MSRRTLLAALLVSLAANAFLGGRLAAEWLRPRPDPLAAEHIVRRLESRLPGAQQPVLRRAFDTRSAELRRTGDELLAARRELRDALTADPVDPARLARACARTRAAAAATYAVVHAAMIEAAPHLSVSARKALLRPLPDA